MHLDVQLHMTMHKETMCKTREIASSSMHAKKRVTGFRITQIKTDATLSHAAEKVVQT